MTIPTLEIRRTNSAGPYGMWLDRATHDLALSHVFAAADDEIAERGIDSGEIEVGGQVWLFRDEAANANAAAVDETVRCQCAEALGLDAPCER